MIGEHISPVLSEMEQAIWEHEDFDGSKPNYTLLGFRAVIKLFMSVMMDRMYEVHENENMSMEEREKMTQRLGEEVRKLVKTYTDIDTHDLYK